MITEALCLPSISSSKNFMRDPSFLFSFLFEKSLSSAPLYVCVCVCVCWCFRVRLPWSPHRGNLHLFKRKPTWIYVWVLHLSKDSFYFSLYLLVVLLLTTINGWLRELSSVHSWVALRFQLAADSFIQILC